MSAYLCVGALSFGQVLCQIDGLVGNEGIELLVFAHSVFFEGLNQGVPDIYEAFFGFLADAEVGHGQLHLGLQEDQFMHVLTLGFAIFDPLCIHLCIFFAFYHSYFDLTLIDTFRINFLFSLMCLIFDFWLNLFIL